MVVQSSQLIWYVATLCTCHVYSISTRVNTVNMEGDLILDPVDATVELRHVRSYPSRSNTGRPLLAL